jgi:cysteine desulfurase
MTPEPGVIYLDYQATTPCDPRVVTAMQPLQTESFGNPHSNHALGRAAAKAIDTARGRVGALINARPSEILFTSGATEANNLAIKGALRGGHNRGSHIVTLATEHSSVLGPVRRLVEEGYRATELGVPRSGIVDPASLERALTAETVLVSAAAANSEIGVLQPLAEIGALCRHRGILFHCDAAQGFGKIAMDVAAMGIDLMSISAHKVYGPKGIGALYRSVRPTLPLAPLSDGGGQEWGLRPGTLPVPLCVGLGVASEIAGAEMAAEGARLRRVRDRLYHRLASEIRNVRLNGDPARRLAGNLNLAFPGIDGMDLIDELPGLALATGAACAGERSEPSHVLKALGLDDRLASGSLRISLGRFTTESEIDAAASMIIAAVRRLT